MKAILGLLLAFVAPALTSVNVSAANIYVRDASVGRSAASNRADLTRSIRDTVKGHAADRLVGSEDRSDATLLPRLAGEEGNYTLTIERIENGRTISSIERTAGTLTEISALAPQATLAALSSSNSSSGATVAASDSDSSTVSRGGESRGSGPGSRRSGAFGPGKLSIGLGPSFASGMNADNVMYNAALGYSWDLNPQLAAKVVGEANLGSASDNGRLMDVSVGGDVYIDRIAAFSSARPFVSGTLGLGTARNQASDTATGVTAGAGAGFRFATDSPQTVDVLVHYKIMTAAVAGANPSVLGLRAGVNF